MIRQPNFYAGGGLDRAGHLRSDEGWLQARRSDPQSLLVPIWRNQNLFRVPVPPDGGAEPLMPALAQVPGASEIGALLQDGESSVLLGIEEGRAHFALDLSAFDEPLHAAALFGGGEFADLRRYGPLLSQPAGAELAYGRGMLYWHGRHRFCGVCGTATRSAEAGHVRRCTNPDCATSHFPRTDPAVIMLVTDGERCLLGRQAAWLPGMHSTLAGFVEPGESLEEAVAREVFEETGVRLGAVRYHSSQPWPFPASIMLGFHADAASDAITVKVDEIEDARWFTRAQLLSSPENETFRLPRTDSIARRLIESWLKRD